MEPTLYPAYAGFWKRFLATLIDGVLISIVGGIIMIPFMGILGLGAASEMQFQDENYYAQNPDAAMTMAAGILAVALVICVVFFIVQWLYCALMESSAKQATLGKMALGIKVTDLYGKRISFGRATGRYFAKLISGAILYIGYIMAAFTEKKQALHDMLAQTLVVEK